MPARRSLLDPADPCAIAALVELLGVTPAMAGVALAQAAARCQLRSAGATRTARWRAKRAEATAATVEPDVTKGVTSVTKASHPAPVTNVTESVTNVTQASHRTFRSSSSTKTFSTEEQVKSEEQDQETGAEKSSLPLPSKRATKPRTGRPRKFPTLPPDFLALYAESWAAAYPGSGFFGRKHADHIGKLEVLHGHDETLRRWKNHLARTPAMYASGAKLFEAWSEWAVGAEAGGRGVAMPTPIELAARRCYGLWREINAVRHDAALVYPLIDGFVAAGTVTSREAMIGVVQALDGSTMRNAREARWAERHIVERAGPLLLDLFPTATATAAVA